MKSHLEVDKAKNLTKNRLNFGHKNLQSNRLRMKKLKRILGSKVNKGNKLNKYL